MVQSSFIKYKEILLKCFLKELNDENNQKASDKECILSELEVGQLSQAVLGGKTS